MPPNGDFNRWANQGGIFCSCHKLNLFEHIEDRLHIKGKGGKNSQMKGKAMPS